MLRNQYNNSAYIGAIFLLTNKAYHPHYRSFNPHASDQFHEK
jgi:hypothetical protein